MKLYDYQRDARDKMLTLKGVGLLGMEMGTGKTRVALAVARRMGLTKLVVVVPLSAVSVWRDELRRVWKRCIFVDATEGTVRERAALMKQALRRERRPVLVAVGYETYWRPPLRRQFDAGVQGIIYDEVHRLKGRGSKRTRMAHTLTRRIRMRLGLSGTPAPNGFQDLFGVMKALNPRVFGTRYADFEERYITKGGYWGREITGYRNEDEIEERLQEHAFRITKDEALDLPPRTDVNLRVKMSAKERKVYDRMEEHAISEIDGYYAGRAASGVAVSRIVLTNILRLQQVTSGFIKVSDGREIEFGSSKLDTLRDFLEDAIPQVGRVVVFCRFTKDIDRVRDMVQKSKLASAFQYDGRVKRGKKREAVLKNFRVADRAVLVAHIAVASLAIDLTAAHVGVFYSPSYSFEQYAQSRDRLHRIGQKHPVTYYHLVTHDSIDEEIQEALGDKSDMSKRIMKRRALR